MLGMPGALAVTKEDDHETCSSSNVIGKRPHERPHELSACVKVSHISSAIR